MVGRVDSFSLLLFIALWATQSLTAQQPQITGAFGYKLGEKFDTSKAIKKIKLADGDTTYMVASITPYHACNFYFVQITPKTHLIYAIIAEGWFNNVKEAQIELQLIIEILQRKYSNSEEETLSPLQYMFMIGSRSVIVLIKEEESDTRFIINYTDLHLFAQDRIEQREIDQSSL